MPKVLTTDKLLTTKEQANYWERKYLESEAGSLHKLGHAYSNILANNERMGMSAVVVSLTALGGREILPPFCIYDGLSKETCEAIKNDIERTVRRLIAYLPTALRTELAKEK
jgi:hypothetical protein